MASKGCVCDNNEFKEPSILDMRAGVVVIVATTRRPSPTILVSLKSGASLCRSIDSRGEASKKGVKVSLLRSGKPRANVAAWSLNNNAMDMVEMYQMLSIDTNCCKTTKHCQID